MFLTAEFPSVVIQASQSQRKFISLGKCETDMFLTAEFPSVVIQATTMQKLLNLCTQHGYFLEVLHIT
jgi:hypothetical protein